MSALELTRVETINAEHAACEAAAHSAVKHAIRCGQMLEEEKAKRRHGEWSRWLEEHFVGSARAAQTYMKLAREKDKLANTQHAADMSIRGALRELSVSEADAKLEYHKAKAIEHTRRGDEARAKAEQALADARAKGGQDAKRIEENLKLFARLFDGEAA